MARINCVGAAPTTHLLTGIGSGDTSFTVVSGGGTGYPTGGSGNFVVDIDRGTASEEKILCSGRSTDVFTVATSGRGYDQTSPAAHSGGATVDQVMPATLADEANAHVNTVSRDDHTQYIRADGTRAFTGHAAIAGVPGSITPGDTAAIGSGNLFALSTHRHGATGLLAVQIG